MPKPFYFYDSEIGCYNYSIFHPMKPQRVQMTHELVKSYNLTEHLDLKFLEEMTTLPKIDFTKFHSDEYVEFLKKITVDELPNFYEETCFFNIDEQDCPVFDNIYDYCTSYTTGTILAAEHIMNSTSRKAINWSGGLHHAKKCEASGFCYINDCVLGILDLLTKYDRVLYIDIDVHHGDGVEEAFYCTDRVMTVSFHKYGDFFPGTGALTDVGAEKGKYYSVNVPLKEGIDDITFEELFKKVMDNVLDKFRPGAIMLQCGADSISGDRLGCFNLSVKGHGKAVEYIKSKNIPTIYLGGGGYTLRNVPRCWAYETSILVDNPVENNIPMNCYSEYFYPEYLLHIPTTNMENLNDELYIQNILSTIDAHLKNVVQSYSSFSIDENYEIPKLELFNYYNE